MTSDQITGIIRAVGAAIGGFVIAKGWFSAETWSWIIGGVVTIGTALWSLWTNRPASLAAGAQQSAGVNVQTTSATPPTVTAAISAVKATQ